MLAFPKPQSVAAERKAARNLVKARRAIVYRLVTKRDRTCRACGTRSDLQHHHIKLRSAGGDDTEANIVRLCACCHADRHAARLQIIGDDARYTLTFRKVGR